MQKINFQNLPNTTTPVNDTNLNAMQTNAENAINGTVLYNNTNGTNTSLTLSDSASNYTYIDVYYGTSGCYCGVVRVYQPEGKTFTLNVNDAYNDACYYKNSRWYFSTTHIYISGANAYTIYVGNLQDWSGGITNQSVLIFRVVGYKE